MPVQCVVEDMLYFHNLRFGILFWVTLCMSRYVFPCKFKASRAQPPPAPRMGCRLLGHGGGVKWLAHKFLPQNTTTLDLPVILLSLVTFSHNVGNFTWCKHDPETSTSQTFPGGCLIYPWVGRCGIRHRFKFAVKNCVASLLCNQWKFKVPGINAKVNGSQY